MSMRPLALGAALAICAPVLWGALVTGDVAPGTAALRLGVTLAATLFVAGWFEGLVQYYGRSTDLSAGADRADGASRGADGAQRHAGGESAGDPRGSRVPVQGVPVSRRSTDAARPGSTQRKGVTP